MPDIILQQETPLSAEARGPRVWEMKVSPAGDNDVAMAMVELPGLAGFASLHFGVVAPDTWIGTDWPEVRLLAVVNGAQVECATLLDNTSTGNKTGITAGYQALQASVNLTAVANVLPSTRYLLSVQYAAKRVADRADVLKMSLVARLGSGSGGGGSNGGSGVALKDVSFCTDGHTNLRNWQENVVNWEYWDEGAYYGDPRGVWSSFMAVEKVGDYGLWMFGGVVADRDALWTTSNKVVSIAAGTTMFILPESHRFADERQIYVNWNAFTPLPLRIRANGEVYSKWDLRPSNDEGGFHHANQQVFRAWPLSEVGGPTA